MYFFVFKRENSQLNYLPNMPNVVGPVEFAGAAPKLRPIVGATTFVVGTVGAEKLKLPAGAAAAVVPPSPPKPPRPPRLKVAGAFAVAWPNVGSVGATEAEFDKFKRGCTVPVGLAKAPNPPKPVDVVGVPKDGATDTAGAPNDEAPKPPKPPATGVEPNVGSAGVEPNDGAVEVTGVPNAGAGATAPNVGFAGVLNC